MSARHLLTVLASGFVLVLMALVPVPASAMTGESVTGAGTVSTAFCADSEFELEAVGAGEADDASGTFSLNCPSTGATATGSIDCLRVIGQYSGTFGIELRAELGGQVSTASANANPDFAAGKPVTLYVYEDSERFGPGGADQLGVWSEANDCSDDDTGQAAGLTSGVLTINQTDQDEDGVTDGRDDCPAVFNPWQEGAENNCPDADSDGAMDSDDNCPTVANPAQTDTDGDGEGDECDATPNGDTDEDGVGNDTDNCPIDYNEDQADSDGDGLGDECDDSPTTDTDEDGVEDGADNCASDANADQVDTDGDGVGDVCDETPNGDTDGDGVGNAPDNCPGRRQPRAG